MFELSVEEHKATILASLARYLGPKAEEPVVYYESDWGSEEWTRGAYAASFDLGGLHRYGADSRTPVGPIHFSCSDIAAEGYQHRSEEHTSELQSLMRISYAVFCLKKKKIK